MLNIGDRVIVTRNFTQDNYNFKVGHTGTVLANSDSRDLIEWDFESPVFHNGGQWCHTRNKYVYGRKKHCYYIDDYKIKCLEIIPKKKCNGGFYNECD